MQPIPGPVSPSRGNQRPKQLSFAQKLYRSLTTPRIMIAGLFASTVAFMLLLAGDGMEILTAVRGFVAAEGQWASTQKDAALFLQKYETDHDEYDYTQFRRSLQVLLDFSRVREQLLSPTPDYRVVERTCQARGIHSVDVDGMLQLYRRFREVEHMQKAMRLWTAADHEVVRLAGLGESIHEQIIGGNPDAAEMKRLLEDVTDVETRLPVIEENFAATFADAGRWAKDLFKWTIAISAALLLTLGILITWRLLSEAIEAKEKYRQLINTASDAILVATPDTGRIIEANMKAEQMTGLPISSLIGRRIQHLLNSEDRTALELLVRGESNGHKSAEFEVHNVSGNTVPVEASVNLTTLNGRVVVQSILRDISDRKRLESQLRQAAKMDAVGRLAGGIAHDFNNLLTVISGYGQLLQSQLENDESAMLSVEQILKAADRATSLTRQLLAFSRHNMLKPRVIDLNETISGVESMLRRLIGENISLEFTPTVGLGYVKADAAQIEQVIVNLVVNARDAMPSGGRLRIQTRNLELNEKQTFGHAFLKPGSYVALTVSDDGVGMDEKTKTCIFEPFFTTKESGKGTGLGLAMVYGTVKQSDGYVLVQSEPGEGTSFEIYLPRVFGRKSEEREEQLPAASGGAETVLIVEDQLELRALLRTVLQRNGYTVLEAPDGKAALTTFHENAEDIDLVITDVVMPEMGGVDLGMRLKEYSEETKILYISGYTDSLMPRQSIPAGANFLQKPFTPEILSRKVREVLDDHLAHRKGHPQAV